MEQVSNFYTSTGIHVYFKDQMHDHSVDVEKVVTRLESLIPTQLLSEVEMIIIGHFDEFDERNINAFYKDGALHISNLQMDEDGLLDDMIHETAHAVEIAYGQQIYADSKIKDEFLRKRNHLSDVVNGIFISPYSPTSLREYFATGFTEFYMHPNNHGFLKKTSPALYSKLEKINNIESLDI